MVKQRPLSEFYLKKNKTESKRVKNKRDTEKEISINTQLMSSLKCTKLKEKLYNEIVIQRRWRERKKPIYPALLLTVSHKISAVHLSFSTPGSSGEQKIVV